MTEVERAYANPWARFVISHVGLSIALTIDDTELIDLWLTRILEHGPAKPASILIKMYDLLGDRDASLEWLRDYDSSEFWTDYYVLLWASYYGDGELALEAMRRSPDLWSFWIPLHAHLRETGEFKEIVQDMGLVDYWREHGWNDFCQPVGDDDFECR